MKLWEVSKSVSEDMLNHWVERVLPGLRKVVKQTHRRIYYLWKWMVLGVMVKSHELPKSVWRWRVDEAWSWMSSNLRGKTEGWKAMKQCFKAEGLIFWNLDYRPSQMHSNNYTTINIFSDVKCIKIYAFYLDATVLSKHESKHKVKIEGIFQIYSQWF